MTSSLDNQIAVHLEEYKALTSEIHSSAAHQDQLFNWTLVFFVGVSGLFFGYPAALNTAVQMRLQWMLLLIPLVFIAIAFDYQLQYFNITNVACYLNQKLRPILCSLLGMPKDQLLGWEDYLDKARRKSGPIERIAMNARYVIIHAMALLWWLFFIWLTRVYYDISWGMPDLTLLTFGLLGMLLLLYSNVLVVARFRDIAREVPLKSENQLQNKTQDGQND